MAGNIQIGEPSTLSEMHQCMNAAFSDYLVPLQLPYEHFQLMLSQRGFDPGLTRIARSDGQAVSFWLIASRPNGTANNAYTIATGTLPEQRGRGLAEKVFYAVRSELAAQGFDGLQLEVIEANGAARKLYEKLGFEVRREVICFRLETADLPPASNQSITLRPCDLRDIGEQLIELQDWPPSWQNSFDSLNAIAEMVTVLGAFDGDRCLGYGALIKHNTVLAQLAVRPGHRRQGLGSAILAALAKGQPGLEIINIDARDTGTKAFFENRGAKTQFRQHEMVYSLIGF